MLLHERNGSIFFVDEAPKQNDFQTGGKKQRMPLPQDLSNLGKSLIPFFCVLVPNVAAIRNTTKGHSTIT